MKWKNKAPKSFALGSENVEDTSKMKVVRNASFTAGTGDSSLKIIVPEWKEFGKKLELPGIYCNCLPKEEKQIPKKHLLAMFVRRFTVRMPH